MSQCQAASLIRKLISLSRSSTARAEGKVSIVLNPVLELPERCHGAKHRLQSTVSVRPRRCSPRSDPNAYRRYGQSFMLHPRELVLGVTIEYLRLPQDVIAYLIGRSTWGTLGLIIATATLLHPGFKGCPTSELVNHANIPIPLYPGWRIAQLMFHELDDKEENIYKNKYTGWVGPTSPGFSGICEETDLLHRITTRR